MRTLLTVLAWTVGVVATLGVLFVVSFRTKAGPVMRFVRRSNRRFANPRQLQHNGAGQPGAYASVVRHVGRTSGTAYRTPVVAIEDGEDVVVALPYGPTADWVRNVLAAGTAELEHEGVVVTLEEPRVQSMADCNHLFPAREQRQHRLFGVDDFLRARTLRPDAAASTEATGGRPATD